jgi:hypothetical protein
LAVTGDNGEWFIHDILCDYKLDGNTTYFENGKITRSTERLLLNAPRFLFFKKKQSQYHFIYANFSLIDEQSDFFYCMTLK